METRRALAVFALLGALALAGCASEPAGSPVPSASSGSGSSGASGELELDAGWLDGGRMVALVTQGSSTCVPSASDVTVQADGSVAVTLVDPETKACTRDLVPRASLVQLPAGVSGELELVVTYGDVRGDTDLDAYAGGAVEEFTPSAGWTDDDQLVILTWGSSTCVPAVQDAAVSGNQVTVTFADAPADQICTSDMAPRATLVTVPGADDDAAELVLSGGGFDVTLPIVG